MFTKFLLLLTIEAPRLIRMRPAVPKRLDSTVVD